LARGLTLGLLLGRPGTAAQRLAQHGDLHGEQLLVLGALFVDGVVARRALPARLHYLLQPRLRVDRRRTAAQVYLVADGPQDEAARHCQAAVDGDSADDRLEQAGEVGVAITPSRALFAVAEQQVLAKAETASEHRQAVALHQVAAPLGQRSLVDVWVVAKQALRDDVA